MLVRVAATTRTVTVERRDEFDSLKVVADGPDSVVVELLGATPEPDGHAWLPAGSIEAWASPVTAEWRVAYRAMLAKVEPYGWYRPASDEVKVHIERRAR